MYTIAVSCRRPRLPALWTIFGQMVGRLASPTTPHKPVLIRSRCGSYLPTLARSSCITRRALHLASPNSLERLQGWGLIPASPRRTGRATITGRRPYVSVNIRVCQPRHL